MATDDVLVFIVSRNTTTSHRRVLWRMSRSDAVKVCSDDRTSNNNHMLCWTADDIDNPEVNRFIPDNGKYADVLSDHGVTVLFCL